MIFQYKDLEGGVYILKTENDRITEDDVKNYNSWIQNIVHCRQEDVIIGESYKIIEDDEDEE